MSSGSPSTSSLLAYVRPYRRYAVWALLLLAVLVALDLAIPRLVQRIIDQGIHRGSRAVILSTAGAMLGISVVSTLAAIGNNVYSVRVGEGVARDLRLDLFLYIQRFSFGNLDQQKTGQLMVRLTSDVAAVKMLTQVSLRIGTRAPLLMLGSLGLMIATSPKLALTMLPLLVLAAVLIGFFVLRMESMFASVQRTLDALNTVLQENISGARLVKALVRATHESARFESANEDMTQRSIRVMKFMSSMSPILTMAVNAGVVVVIWQGGLQSVRGQLSVGQLVAFSNYLFTTMSPLIMMAMLSNVWAAGLASARRIHGVFATQPDVVDAPGAEDVAPGRVSVRFDDVTFAYGGERPAPVLRNVSFEARPGQTVAILGATGAGKSTLVNLIPRLYDVTSGCVLVNDRDVRTLTQASLRAAVGLVPQDSVLFSGTIRDNIRYGRPSAGDAEVVAAAQAAQADDFIRAMDQGYESRVEQRGVNLSGGQKQRLAIARALLLNPRILILDDSTSAVDVDTETKIQDALARLSAAGRTTFVVAQRISTVLRADMILVLDKGKVVAQGMHAQLLASSPIYQEIYESQLGGGAKAAGP